MNKLSQLVVIIEKFSKEATWGYRLLKNAQDNKNLLSALENYDIKDEELFEQLETFTNSYKEFISAYSQVNPKTLNEETISELSDILSILNKRGDKIIHNNYLNMSEENGWDEDFSAGDFTETIVNIINDASNKLQEVLGEEISTLEMPSTAVQQMFSEFQEGYTESGKAEEWSAYKKDKQSEYSKKRRELLSFLKKTNPQHEMYQNYISSRKRTYQNIISDPNRKAHYREKAKLRQRKFQKKLDIRKREILEVLQRTKDPKKIEELHKELQSIESNVALKHERNKQMAQKIKQTKEAKNLNGLTIHLQQKIASLKSEAVKAIKDQAKTDPVFFPYKREVELAKQAHIQEPTTANQALLENAIRKEAEALKEYLDNHPTVLKIRSEIEKLYAYRDKSKQLNDLGWVSGEYVPEETVPYLREFIGEGESLIKEFNKYRGIVATLTEIVNFIKGKL